MAREMREAMTLFFDETKADYLLAPDMSDLPTCPPKSHGFKPTTMTETFNRPDGREVTVTYHVLRADDWRRKWQQD